MLLVVCSIFFSLCASFSCWRGVAQRWREKLERLAAVRCAVQNSKLWVCIIPGRFFKRFFAETDFSPDCAVRFTGAALMVVTLGQQ